MDSPDWDATTLCIRTAGNTFIPCLQVMHAKGYTVRQRVPQVSDSEDEVDFEAIKDGRLFAAGSPEELLGLIAMWEVRGDDWQHHEADEPLYDQHDANPRVYDFGQAGE